MIKDVDSAYKHTMNVIDSLQKGGIETLIRQPRIIREAEKPEELEVVKRFNKPDRLHYSDWRNVQFKVKSQLEAEKVSFARRYLGINGCSFDTGAGCGGMDWEIDWSFKFTGIEEAMELRKLGFDELCLGSFYTDIPGNNEEEYDWRKKFIGLEYHEVGEDQEPNFMKNTDMTYYVAAPLYDQAFSFFEEKYKLEGWTLPLVDEQGFVYAYEARYHKEEDAVLILGIYSNKLRAKLACLRKLIELCKK